MEKHAFGPLSTCDVYIFNTKIGDCDWKTFTNLSNPQAQRVYAELQKNCNLNGFCRPECQATLDRYADHPCWNGEADRFVKRVFASYPEGVELLGRLHSCQDSNRDVCSKDECSHWCADDDDSVYDGAPKTHLTDVLNELIKYKTELNKLYESLTASCGDRTNKRGHSDIFRRCVDPSGQDWLRLWRWKQPHHHTGHVEGFSNTDPATKTVSTTTAAAATAASNDAEVNYLSIWISGPIPAMCTHSCISGAIDLL
ncbi:temptin [Plakobranchus ocellatus]|uniref:Temptin n=1 Tax=Plakobranchus ocellatus TaxID=259542 RepID=A0AAV3YAT3_9GAST|nr:temptin [Plakobranchus ocellatus]